MFFIYYPWQEVTYFRSEVQMKIIQYFSIVLFTLEQYMIENEWTSADLLFLSLLSKLQYTFINVYSASGWFTDMEHICLKSATEFSMIFMWTSQLKIINCYSHNDHCFLQLVYFLHFLLTPSIRMKTTKTPIHCIVLSNHSFTRKETSGARPPFP